MSKKPVMVASAVVATLAGTAMGQTTYTDPAAFYAAVGPEVKVIAYDTAPRGTAIPFGTMFEGVEHHFNLLPPTTLPTGPEVQVGGVICARYINVGGLGLAVERDGIPFDDGVYDFFFLPESITVVFPTPVTAVGMYFGVGASSAVKNYCFIATEVGLAEAGGEFPDPATNMFFAGLVSDVPFQKAEIGCTAEAPSGFTLDQLSFLPEGGGCDCVCNYDTSTGGDVCDFFDFIAFQDLFGAGDPCGCELDTSTGAGVCDFFDFIIFQDLFSVGC